MHRFPHRQVNTCADQHSTDAVMHAQVFVRLRPVYDTPDSQPCLQVHPDLPSSLISKVSMSFDALTWNRAFSSPPSCKRSRLLATVVPRHTNSTESSTKLQPKMKYMTR